MLIVLIQWISAREISGTVILQKKIPGDIYAKI